MRKNNIFSIFDKQTAKVDVRPFEGSFHIAKLTHFYLGFGFWVKLGRMEYFISLKNVKKLVNFDGF